MVAAMPNQFASFALLVSTCLPYENTPEHFRFPMHIVLNLRLLLACCFIAMLPSQSLLGSLVVSSMPGTTHEIEGLTGFGTTSADMVGLEIVIYFNDGSTDVGIWTPTGISQNNWSINQGIGQSTFNFPFTLSNNTGLDITRFTLNGAGTSTFFDRTAPAPGTDGSANGRDLQEFSTLRFSQDIEAVYFDQIQLVGSTPQGDLFAGLDISFSDGISGSGGLFSFRTDTDTSFGLVTSTVPEPSSAIQFGIALTAVLLRRRRRQTV